MTRRRAAVYAGLVGLGWWRWHAREGRWYMPEAVILRCAWELSR